MPNITIQVSEELYQHARLSAARRNMSVSAMIRALLPTTEKDPTQSISSGPGIRGPLPALGRIQCGTRSRKFSYGTAPQEHSSLEPRPLLKMQKGRDPHPSPMFAVRICNSVNL